MSHSSPRCPKMAVVARKDRSCVRRVVWPWAGRCANRPVPAAAPPGSTAGWSAAPGRRCSPRPRPAGCAPGCRGRPGRRRRSSFRSRPPDARRAAHREAGTPRGSARAPRAAVVSHLGQVPVLVPLQVGDVVFAQQRIQAVEQVVPGIRIRQVEHLLIAPRQGIRPKPGAGDPVGVGADEVRVRVDHFRFDPETELHPAAGTASISGVSPSGQRSSSTYQSPRPA